jgi:hypothetical protein
MSVDSNSTPSFMLSSSFVANRIAVFNNSSNCGVLESALIQPSYCLYVLVFQKIIDLAEPNDTRAKLAF